MTDATNAKAEAKTILEAKEKLSNVLPTPSEQQMPISSPQALKERLEWGEPALTILDARSREAYLEEHITGAMLFSDFESSFSTVSPRRDMYVYGENEEATSLAADTLRQAGFERVSQIKGGLSAWKSIKGPTEGRAA